METVIEKERETTAIVGEKKVLNFREVCDYTGFSKSHLYKLTSAKKIPHYCPQGKLLFFNRLELEDWLQRGRQSSVVEIEEKASMLKL